MKSFRERIWIVLSLVRHALFVLFGGTGQVFLLSVKKGQMRVSWQGRSCALRTFSHSRDPETGDMRLEVLMGRSEGVPFVPLSVLRKQIAGG